MNYTELSLEKLRGISIEVAKTIKSKQEVDLIIYVAKAGFAIAYYMNEIFNVKLLGVAAHRKGNNFKAKVASLLAFLPRRFKDFLRVIELKSKLHNKCTERYVQFFSSIKSMNTSSYRNILIVDDSVDTGHSMKSVYEITTQTFTNASITTYSLNVWEQSKTCFHTDYNSFEDTVIRTPMSKDSREYGAFINLYDSEATI